MTYLSLGGRTCLFFAPPARTSLTSTTPSAAQVNHDVEYHWAVMRQDARAMHAVGALARSGGLVVPVGVVVSLDDARKAHELADSKSVVGKIVMTP